MTWRTDLEVGNSAIDTQHRTLVDTLNRLHSAMKLGKGKDEIQSILNFLKSYTVDHFIAEEAIMVAHAYPETKPHMAIHADLVKQVDTLVKDHEAGKALMTSAVLDFLESWLTKHIMTEDMALGRFLREKGVAA
jgi:hemerythrin-like metal-binding protein